jgi:hypothetical protein
VFPLFENETKVNFRDNPGVVGSVEGCKNDDDGAVVGIRLGTSNKIADGINKSVVDISVGIIDEKDEGTALGTSLGAHDGITLGIDEGHAVGDTVGTSLGS